MMNSLSTESGKFYAATYKNVNCSISHWDLAVAF